MRIEWYNLGRTRATVRKGWLRRWKTEVYIDDGGVWRFVRTNGEVTGRLRRRLYREVLTEVDPWVRED